MFTEKSPGNASRLALNIVLFFAVLGLWDAVYLTANHYAGNTLNCGRVFGCDRVLTSTYATIFGTLPVALLGAVYYTGIISLAFLYLHKREFTYFRLLFLLVSGGFLFSLWLTYLQLFTIKALCPYCLFSAGITAVIYALLFVQQRKIRGKTGGVPGATTATVINDAARKGKSQL